MLLEEFHVWANRLGCPLEFIPSEDALKSIFKSRQRDVFCNLMKRVQPQQDVQEIRENILIRRMGKLKSQELVVPVCSRIFLPKEVQLYLKLKDLSKKKEKAESRLEEYKREYDALATSIKRKNIQSIGLEHNQRTLQDKITLLRLKSESLDADLNKELQHKAQITANMPAKLNATNASETAAMEAIQKALNILESFYNFCMENRNAHSLQVTKEELWQKMRSIFADIPNFLLFNAILRSKDEQLQNVIALNQMDQEKSQLYNHSGSYSKDSLCSFEVQLMKTKADLLGLVARYLSARHERIELEEKFSSIYTPFVNDLQRKVNIFNADVNDEDVDEEIISDFIVQYNLRNFSKAQNDFLHQQIEMYKQEFENGSKQLESHEVLLGSIKQVYSEISASVNRIQYEVMQLSQIKEKILYSQNMMMYMLNDLHTSINGASGLNSKTIQQSGKRIANGGSGVTNTLSPMRPDSFNLSSDNVLCSTKIDMDSTVSSLHNASLGRSFVATDTTILPGAVGNPDCMFFNLPPHSTELRVFSEISLAKLSSIPSQCAFYLSANPLVAETRELLSTIQLAPGILLTPFGALKEVRNRIEWAAAITMHSRDLKLDLEPIMLDSKDLKLKAKQQREHITELVDAVDVTGVKTNRMLQKISRFYDFILENPLRHYIPATKTFNNQTYSDYEAEFNMYYRMATVGASKE